MNRVYRQETEWLTPPGHKPLLNLDLSGEGGIRTRGGCDTTRHFQCRTFGLSVTSPLFLKPVLIFDLRPPAILWNPG